MILGDEDKTKPKPFAVDLPKAWEEIFPAAVIIELCKQILSEFHKDNQPLEDGNMAKINCAVFSGLTTLDGKEQNIFLVMGYYRNKISVDILDYYTYDKGTMPDEVLDIYNIFLKGKNLITKNV